MVTRSGAGAVVAARLLTPGVSLMRPKATTPSLTVAGRQSRAVARRERSRAFVAEVNARTVCAHCGRQPIEWHNPEHATVPGRASYRISNMASAGRTVADIQAEMARCTPLCRRCHMAEDGRLAVIAQSVPEMPERACAECSHVTRRIIGGLCQRCHFRLNPPPPQVRPIRAPALCAECQRPSKPLRRGLCGRCSQRASARAKGTAPAGPRTTCRKGHALTAENVMVEGNGARRCRTCRRAYQKGSAS